MSAGPIERRAQAWAGLLAIGDEPDQVLARATQLADALATLVRDRGLALRLGDAERDFLTLHGWQALGAFMRCTAIVTASDQQATGTWRSTAEVRTADGTVIGAGIGLASNAESRLWKHGAHGLAAMSQTRAMRRALQGAFGWIPGLAGMDVADPTAPATKRQVTALWTLAGELGWDRDQVHAQAGAASLNDLTREEAAELIEAWGRLVEERAGAAVDRTDGEGPGPDVQADTETVDAGAEPMPAASPPDVCDGFGGEDEAAPCARCGYAFEAHEPAVDVGEPEPVDMAGLWLAAGERFGGRVAVLHAVSKLRGGAGVGVGSVTAEELRAVLTEESGT